MKTLDYSYFIERYNCGEMDTIEQNWFEKELSGNDSLQNEVKLRKRVDNAMIRHDLIDLRNKLASLEKMRKEKEVAASGRRGVGVKFAAAIAALLIIGGALLIFTGASPQKLYQKNFTAYNYSSSTRSGAVNSNTDFTEALQLYLNGDYRNAAARFRSYLEKVPGQMDAHLMYGVSEMENMNFPSAEKSFNIILNQDDNMYTDHASWYLSLCYLKTGDRKNAIRQLEAISASDTKYKAKARKLLKKIR
jgi:TolA-binding protein